MPRIDFATKAPLINAVTEIVKDGKFYTVEIVWQNSKGDYLGDYAIQVRNLTEATRLEKAINAGVVFTNVKRARSNGFTYVDFNCHVYGRSFNADLLRLGF